MKLSKNTNGSIPRLAAGGLQKHGAECCCGGGCVNGTGCDSSRVFTACNGLRYVRLVITGSGSAEITGTTSYSGLSGTFNIDDLNADISGTSNFSADLTLITPSTAFVTFGPQGIDYEFENNVATGYSYSANTPGLSGSAISTIELTSPDLPAPGTIVFGLGPTASGPLDDARVASSTRSLSLVITGSTVTATIAVAYSEGAQLIDIDNDGETAEGVYGSSASWVFSGTIPAGFCTGTPLSLTLNDVDAGGGFEVVDTAAERTITGPTLISSSGTLQLYLSDTPATSAELGLEGCSRAVLLTADVSEYGTDTLTLEDVLYTAVSVTDLRMTQEVDGDCEFGNWTWSGTGTAELFNVSGGSIGTVSASATFQAVHGDRYFRGWGILTLIAGSEIYRFAMTIPQPCPANAEIAFKGDDGGFWYDDPILSPQWQHEASTASFTATTSVFGDPTHSCDLNCDDGPTYIDSVVMCGETAKADTTIELDQNTEYPCTWDGENSVYAAALTFDNGIWTYTLTRKSDNVVVFTSIGTAGTADTPPMSIDFSGSIWDEEDCSPTGLRVEFSYSGGGGGAGLFIPTAIDGEYIGSEPALELIYGLGA